MKQESLNLHLVRIHSHILFGIRADMLDEGAALRYTFLVASAPTGKC